MVKTKKFKGTLLDLGFDRGFKGRPPSALGLYIMSLMFIALSLWTGLCRQDYTGMWGGLGIGIVVWLIAWCISVPITDMMNKGVK